MSTGLHEKPQMEFYSIHLNTKSFAVIICGVRWTHLSYIQERYSGVRSQPILMLSSWLTIILPVKQ